MASYPEALWCPGKDWGSIHQTIAKTVTYPCSKSNACTTGLCSCRPCSSDTAPGRAAGDSLAWLGSLRPNGPGGRSLKGLGDPLGIYAKEVDQHPEQTLQLSLVPSAPARSRPPRPQDAFEASRCIDVFPLPAMQSVFAPMIVHSAACPRLPNPNNQNAAGR